MNELKMAGCAVIVLLCLCTAGPALVHADDLPVVGIDAGEMYPDFLLPTLDGELHRFSEYRGKKILLFHFASW